MLFHRRNWGAVPAGQLIMAGCLLMVAMHGRLEAEEVAAAEPGDWPQFLGPEHNGVSRETGLLDAWPQTGPPLLWERPVGTGYSAPSVLGDRLVVHHRQGAQEIVECLDPATGESRWQHSYPSSFRDPYGYNNGPRCSPVLAGDRCFTLGAEGRLACLNLQDGTPVWELDLRERYTIPEGFFGVGASPILEDDRLIVLVGGQPNAGVVAFSAATGEVLWEAVGRDTWNGVPDESGRPHVWEDDEMVVSYSSPLAATIHGRRHLLCLMRQGLVSLDPETGEVLFKYWFRPKVHESVNAARPVVLGNDVLVTAAYRLGAALLRVHADGRSYEVVWRDEQNLLAHWSTPIAIDGHIYGFSGRHEQEGELRCLRATDGAVLWSTDGWGRPTTGLAQNSTTGRVIDRATGEEIPWPFFGRGAKTLVDGKFIVLGERGTLALGKATPAGWTELCRCQAPRMEYPSWVAPVISRGRVYLRGERWLVCLDLRKPAPE